jgi:hypothetical protein
MRPPLKLKYFILLSAAFVLGSRAFATEDPRQPLEPNFDLKLWVALCAAMGTLTTAIVNLVRWTRERSSAARKLELVSHALKLKEFISSEEELPDFQFKTATAAAKEDLSAVLAKIDGTHHPLSKFRKILLIYPPKGWRAWLAHSMFFGVCIFSGAFIAAAVAGQLEDSNASEFVAFIISIILFGTFFQRWATVEYRIANRIRLQPKKLGPLCWYPPISRYGLLAQVVMVSGILRIVSSFAEFLPVTAFAVSIPFPPWVMAFSTVVRAAFLPVGYFWCETEFNLSENSSLKPKRTYFTRSLVQTRNVEQIVGLLAFAILTVWNVILIFELRIIPLAASFPDSEGNPLGLAAAGLGYVTSALVVGWLPWLAVYRGLPALYHNPPRITEPSLTRSTNEDLNG